MPAAEKPIPETTLDNLLVPNKEYTYFEGWQEHPFKHKANDFEMVNAWWLAEAAFLAYAEPCFANPQFLNAQFSDARYFTDESTQCYVAHNDDIVIVAFRGTEAMERECPEKHNLRNIVADWVADSRIGLVDFGQGGSVHHGFRDALDEVWNHKQLKPYLDEVKNKDGRSRPVWFTGHSLGGALATLAAYRYNDVAGLYTFGSPRVGDYAFARAFANSVRVDTYRFVNNEDIITKVPSLSIYCDSVPLPGLYRHIGHLKYIDYEGNVHDNPGLLARLRDNIHGVRKNTVDYLRYLRLRFQLRILPKHPEDMELPRNFLTDHAPIYYAVYTWNNYVKNLRGGSQQAPG